MTSAAHEGGTGRRMSIGEVLALLRREFPTVSISKIRFLEAEGLVEPERTPSGYRKFSATDVERLRYVLAAQRDRYLPLKVIKEHLDALERGLEPPASAGEAPRAPRPVRSVPAASADGGDEGDGADDADDAARAARSMELRMSRRELAANSGLGEDLLTALLEFGIIRPRPGSDHFDADALAVASAVTELTSYGLEPRHIRAFKTAADREVGLIEQVVSPLVRQRDEAARARAEEVVEHLATLSVQLHAALVRTALRAPR